MGLLHDDTFLVRVQVDGGEWRWLHSPPPRTRITTTKDRRLALAVMDPAFARPAVEGWVKRGGVPEGSRVAWEVLATGWRGERVVQGGELVAG